ncbi:hypothetical protein POM88_004129 [Heracleum sosnowskyi]|uniref:F-box associated domain-containing protein n=1 Tax=Heracleum sosnowskyi TaxID=360622 RepID=A0AAD8NCA2_9APIA|nr:hypothetical protein POM88_004129 [Heracleum sosnowskyi]
MFRLKIKPTDLWKAKSVPTVYHLYGSFGSYLNGSVYWIARKANSVLVVAFDLSGNGQREILLPTGVSNDLNLRFLNGSLCLADSDDSHVNICSLNRCGVEDSWSKLFSVEISVSLKVFQPIAFSRSQNAERFDVRAYTESMLKLSFDVNEEQEKELNEEQEKDKK